MQKRFCEKLHEPENIMRVNLSSIRLPNNPPLHSLINVEVCLINRECKIIENVFSETRSCSTDEMFSTYESETKEIIGSRVDLRDTKFMKLPEVDKASEYRHFYLLFIIRIGKNMEHAGNNSVFSRTKTSVLDLWRQEPSTFTFTPTYLSIMQIFNEKDKIILLDGK